MTRKLSCLLFVCLLCCPLATAASDPPQGEPVEAETRQPTRQPDIAVLRVQSIDALLADFQRIVGLTGEEFEEEKLLEPVKEQFGLSEFGWIDRREPIVVVFPSDGIITGRQSVVGAFPIAVSEVGQAALSRVLEGAAPDDDGIRRLQLGGKEVYVTSRGDYLVVGLVRETVAGFDPLPALNISDLPSGSVALDVFLEPVAQMALMGLDTSRQALQQQMAETEDPVVPAEPGEGDVDTPSPRGFDPRSAIAIVDLYYGVFEDLLNNSSRLQLSFEVGSTHVIGHFRVVPRGASTLEGLLSAQKGGLPKVAAYIEPGDKTMFYAGQIEPTSRFLDAMREFLADYGQAMKGMADALEPNEETKVYAASMRLGVEDIEKWVDCYGGDFAGTVNFGPDGFRGSQVHDAGDSDKCRSLLSGFGRAVADAPVGPDGAPLFKVTENAFSYNGISAFRYEFNLPLNDAVAKEPAASWFFRSWFNQSSMVSLTGVTDDLVITTNGPDADDSFRKIVDRLSAGGFGRGITEESFAPLEVGAGLFGTFDYGKMLETVAAEVAAAGSERSAETGGESEARKLQVIRDLSEGAARIVYGMRLDTDALSIEGAMSLALIEALAKLGSCDDCEHEVTGSAEHEPPPPPQREPRAEGERPLMAGVGDVTNPVIIPETKVEPIYPEHARRARLEGNCIFQVVVRSDGYVEDMEVLRCSREGVGFERASMDAIRHWRYRPATLHGEPVDVYFTIVVTYELQYPDEEVE